MGMIIDVQARAVAQSCSTPVSRCCVVLGYIAVDVHATTEAGEPVADVIDC